MLIDTHAHLHMKPFDGDVEAVLSRALAAGVGHTITVSIDLESLRRNLEIARTYRNISISAGMHPHDAGEFTRENWQEICRLAGAAEVVAVGEAGLDYFRDYAPHDRQRDLFLRHIELANTVGKPLIIHSRAAEEEALEILAREKDPAIGVVMHCYSGSVETARRAVAAGFLVSIAGPVTYPKSDLPAVVEALPADALVVETDAPYLAPQRYRGDRNEPAYIVETARAVADIKGLTEADVARITTFNASRFFGFGPVVEGTVAYPIRNSLYINVTARCSNRCVFCSREKSPVVKGHDLTLPADPTATEMIDAAGDVTGYREVVFCGFGEPLMRWDTVREAIEAFRARGAKRIRINTNGQSRLFLGRDILPEMEGLVDALSVSLNTSDGEQYRKLCRPDDERAYGAVKTFIREARRHVPEVVATAVAAPGIDVHACRALAEEELGVKFRARDYNEVG